MKKFNVIFVSLLLLCVSTNAYSTSFYMGRHTSTSVELYKWDWDGNSTFTNSEHANSFNLGTNWRNYTVGMTFGPDNKFYMGRETSTSVELYRWDWDGNDTFTNPEHVNSFNLGLNWRNYTIGMAFGPDNKFYMGRETSTSVELYKWDWDGNDTFTNSEHVNSFDLGLEWRNYTVGMTFGPDNKFYMGRNTSTSVELYKWDWDGNDTFTNSEHVNSFTLGREWRNYTIGMTSYPIAVPEPATILLSLISVVGIFIRKRRR